MTTRKLNCDSVGVVGVVGVFVVVVSCSIEVVAAFVSAPRPAASIVPKGSISVLQSNTLFAAFLPRPLEVDS